MTALAQELAGFVGKGCCILVGCGAVGAGAGFDLFMISLNSLIDSMKASIISKNAGCTLMLPSGSLFDAHLRQAARILSSGDRVIVSGKLTMEIDGDSRSCKLMTGSRTAVDRFVGRLGGLGGGNNSSGGNQKVNI